jgi:hypothetical protein
MGSDKFVGCRLDLCMIDATWEELIAMGLMMFNFGIADVIKAPLDPSVQLVTMNCGCEPVYFEGVWVGLSGLCGLHTILLYGIPQSRN